MKKLFSTSKNGITHERQSMWTPLHFKNSFTSLISWSLVATRRLNVHTKSLSERTNDQCSRLFTYLYQEDRLFPTAQILHRTMRCERNASNLIFPSSRSQKPAFEISANPAVVYFEVASIWCDSWDVWSSFVRDNNDVKLVCGTLQITSS